MLGSLNSSFSCVTITSGFSNTIFLNDNDAADKILIRGQTSTLVQPPIRSVPIF